jgi:hypothetical protein
VWGRTTVAGRAPETDEVAGETKGLCQTSNVVLPKPLKGLLLLKLNERAGHPNEQWKKRNRRVKGRWVGEN